MRGMFRQCGSIMSISIATAVVARSSYPGAALGHIFLIFAVVLVCVLPLVRKVPEHHGEW